MILDSDVLIDYLKGLGKASEFIDSNSGNLYISILSKFEILTGALNRKDITTLENFLSNFIFLPINNEIIEHGYKIFKEHFLKNGMGTNDAIIAASSIYYKLPLYSRNKKTL